MYKNQVSQKLAVFAYDTTGGPPYPGKTGDAANITAEISKDGGTSAATNDANPTELDAVDHPGLYLFDLTQAETNADLILVTPVSATANIELDPIGIYTMPGTNAGIHADLKTWLGTAPDALTSGKVAANANANRIGTAQAGAAGTITLDASASAVTSYYNGQRCTIIAGTGAGQSRVATAYNGTTKVLTISGNWNTNPDATSVFVLTGANVNLSTWLGVAPNALVSGRVNAIANAIGSAVITSASFGSGAITASAIAAAALNGKGDWNTTTPPTAAAIRSEMDAASTQLAAIVADTNELQTDNVPALIAALNNVSSTEVRDAILNRVLAGNHDTAGTVGLVLQFLDALISSRSSHTAAGVRTEMDANSAQLAAILADTNELQTDDIPGLIAALNDPDLPGIADAVLDEVFEGTTTFRQFLRLAAAALYGKLSGAATTAIAIRDEADTKDRISATVDADGNRTAITLDKS